MNHRDGPPGKGDCGSSYVASDIVDNNASSIPSRSTSPAMHSETSSMKGIGMNHSTWQSADPTSKTIFFLRHAEALHNVPPPDYTIPDPRLTPLGVRQSQRIRDTVPADARANISLIVTSPLRRALQTTLLGFGQQIHWQGVPLEIWPDLQETATHPCDRGSSTQELVDLFPDVKELVLALPSGWQDKGPVDDMWEERIRQRAQKVLKALKDRPERTILVVTHNGFLRRLLGDDVWALDGRVPDGFKNAEVRRFTMLEDGRLMGDETCASQESFDDELERVGALE